VIALPALEVNHVSKTFLTYREDRAKRYFWERSPQVARRRATSAAGLINSANLSWTALTTGVEWSYRLQYA